MEDHDLRAQGAEAARRARGSYRCSRCGQPKKGHVCNSGLAGTSQPPSKRVKMLPDAGAGPATVRTTSQGNLAHQGYEQVAPAGVDAAPEAPQPLGRDAAVAAAARQILADTAGATAILEGSGFTPFASPMRPGVGPAASPGGLWLVPVPRMSSFLGLATPGSPWEGGPRPDWDPAGTPLVGLTQATPPQSLPGPRATPPPSASRLRGLEAAKARIAAATASGPNPDSTRTLNHSHALTSGSGGPGPSATVPARAIPVTPQSGHPASAQREARGAMYQTPPPTRGGRGHHPTPRAFDLPVATGPPEPPGNLSPSDPRYERWSHMAAQMRFITEGDICLLRILSMIPPEDLPSVSLVSKRWYFLVQFIYLLTTRINLVWDPSRPQLAMGILERTFFPREVVVSPKAPMSDGDLAALTAALPDTIQLFHLHAPPSGTHAVQGPGLAGLSDCGRRQLRSLSLEGMGSLQSLQLACSELQHLRVALHRDVGAVQLRCPALVDLDLDLHATAPASAWDSTPAAHTPQDIDLMRSLAEQCPGLLRLTVRSQTLGDTALAALLSGTRMRLASLGVVGAPRLTADGLARALESLPPLTEVDVSGCRSLTDVGLQAMARHSGHTLQRLHAAACPALTRSGVHRALASLSVLRVLDLGMSLAQPHSAPSPATPRDSPPHPVAQGLSPDTSHDGATEPRATTRRLEFSRGPGAEEQVLQVSSPTLEVLSLHGCSRLEGLAVACPRLVHLRLTGCSRLKGHQAHVVVPESCVVDLEGTADGVRGVVMAAMRKAALDAIEHQERDAGGAKTGASPFSPYRLSRRKRRLHTMSSFGSPYRSPRG